MDNIKRGLCAKPCECKICTTNILETIALEEASIAHILNAEGEKIQYAIANNMSTDELIKLNETVAKVIANITRLEIVLTDKLQIALSCPAPHEQCKGTLSFKVVECNCKEPLSGVCIEIRKESEIIAIGETDKTGCFSICLECDCYKVILKYGDQYIAEEVNISCHKQEVCIEKCFSNEVSCSCESTVCGLVQDVCGTPICGCIITDGCRQLAKTNFNGVYVFNTTPQKFLCLTAFYGKRYSQKCCLHDLNPMTYIVNFVIK